MTRMANSHEKLSDDDDDDDSDDDDGDIQSQQIRSLCSAFFSASLRYALDLYY